MDKPKNPRLRHSMIWRLFGSVLLCIALLLVFNWLLNNFALVAFYRAEKEDALARAFRQITRRIYCLIFLGRMHNVREHDVRELIKWCHGRNLQRLMNISCFR